MAGLRNYNGQIVINEQEAAADIKRLRQAKQKIEEARAMLDPAKLDDEQMLGAARNAYVEVLEKLRKELGDRASACESTAVYIRNVVEKYQRIDREFAAKARGGI